jgi:hypothetical protein
MTDKYGNYVVQKLVESVEGDLKQAMIGRIIGFEKQLKA